MQRALFTILFIFIFLCFSCGYKIQLNGPAPKADYNQPVIFQKENYAAFMDEAKSLQKPVFIDFYTSWCAPCKRMDRDVFAGSEAADFLNQQFVNIKLDGESIEGRELVRQFNIRAYPTLVFINKNGKEARRYEGMMTAGHVLRYAKLTAK